MNKYIPFFSSRQDFLEVDGFFDDGEGFLDDREGFFVTEKVSSMVTELTPDSGLFDLLRLNFFLGASFRPLPPLEPPLPPLELILKE